MKHLSIILVAVLVSGCAMTPSSWTKAGVNEKVLNCVKDRLDPSNRGSGCH